jgi:predicted O-linked N-acetylglucosamine transferase (SPINDLY family)
MICTSSKEYEDRAVFFANNAEALSEVRDRLARNRRSYPLFDTPRFVRHLETAYLEMWRRHASQKGPESFDVAIAERHPG